MDNGSSDNSADHADGLPGVTVINLGTNLGFATANNRALALCDTEFVVLLNPDAFAEPEWLDRLLQAAVNHPDVATFGSCQLIYSSENLIDGTGDCYHFSGLVWRNKHGESIENVDLVSREIFAPCAAAAMYRRQTLLDLGGFDEDFFCYVEDVDLGFRLRLAGNKAMYVANAVVHHVGSAMTGGQHSDFSIYHGHRNLVWAFVKNMPGLLFWLLIPFHLALNIVTVIYFIIHGHSRVIIRAKIDAVKGLKSIWKKRKKIQKDRIASIIDIWRVLDKQPFANNRKIKNL